MHLIFNVYVIKLLAYLVFLHQANAQIEKCARLKAAVQINCSCSGDANNDPILDCSGLGLTSVPSFSFSDKIAEFKLNNNNITALGSNAFSGLQIKAIDLGGNDISSVQNDSFGGLRDHLIKLVIQGDGNVSPPKHAFSNILYLETIYLKNYGLAKIDNNNTHHYFFNSFIHLKEITLDSWPNLLDMYQESFSGPQTLKKLSIINMEKLTNFPGNVLAYEHDMKSLESLVIKNTKIDKDIPYMMFEKLNSIKEIDLSYNIIPSIEDGAFDNIGDTLERLDLSHNVLHHLSTPPIIKDIGSLSILDLSNNPDLKKIPELTNLGTKSGLNLNLNNCAIESVRKADLEHITKDLISLDVSKNNIKTIESDSLLEAEKLQTLILDYNSINELPGSLLVANKSLRTLSLSNLDLNSNNSWKIISELTELETLNLSGVQMDSKSFTIPDFALFKLSKLKELILTYAQLSSLTQRSLAGPRRSLRSLSLEGMTSITVFSHCLLYQYEVTGIDINFKDTEINCNECENSWIKTAHTSGKITFQQANGRPKCLDGSDLVNYDFQCQTQSQCEDLYTPTTPAPTTTVRTTTQDEYPEPVVEFTGKLISTLIVKWSVSNTNKLEYFDVIVKNYIYDNTVRQYQKMEKSTVLQVFDNLNASTPYLVCVHAKYKGRQESVQTCKLASTADDPQTPDLNAQTGDDNNIGVIVGATIGGIVLLILIAGILYLLFIRRRAPKKAEMPHSAQPRTFTKAELPSMMPVETRTFTKPKRQPVDSQDTTMQVVAISDGQTGAASPPHVGRADRLLPNDGYKDMSGMKPLKADFRPTSDYENVQGSSPSSPRISAGSVPPSYNSVSYTNEGFHGENGVRL